jgi:hypothetical protein
MNTQQEQTASELDLPTRILYIYLWLTMSLLFIQGSGSLLLRLRPDIEAVTPWLLATLMNGNTPHAILHIIWGSAGLVILLLFRSRAVRMGLGLTFCVFYTLLGFLGIFVYHPFGMRLDFPEDLFHLTVGPLMLVLVWLAWRSQRRALVSKGRPVAS